MKQTETEIVEINLRKLGVNTAHFLNIYQVRMSKDMYSKRVSLSEVEAGDLEKEVNKNHGCCYTYDRGANLKVRRLPRHNIEVVFEGDCIIQPSFPATPVDNNPEGGFSWF